MKVWRTIISSVSDTIWHFSTDLNFIPLFLLSKWRFYFVTKFCLPLLKKKKNTLFCADTYMHFINLLTNEKIWCLFYKRSFGFCLVIIFDIDISSSAKSVWSYMYKHSEILWNNKTKENGHHSNCQCRFYFFYWIHHEVFFIIYNRRYIHMSDVCFYIVIPDIWMSSYWNMHILWRRIGIIIALF